MCKNVKICVCVYVCMDAHLHFRSIVFVISRALYGNVDRFTVFMKRVLGSKSRINYGPHIPIQIELFVHLINIGRVYIQPVLASFISLLVCPSPFSLSLNVARIKLVFAFGSNKAQLLVVLHA